MPSGVFYIVWVDGLMRFELLPTLLELTLIIMTDSTLPQVRPGLGVEFYGSLKVTKCPRDLVISKPLHAA